MYKTTNKYRGLSKIVATAFLLLFTLAFASCSNDEEPNQEEPNQHKKEGLIKLYSNGEIITYSEIFEYPFVEYSPTSMRSDTIGVAYTAYRDKKHSSIGSLLLLVKKENMELYCVEYRLPTSEISATVHSRYSFDETFNPLTYSISDNHEGIKGNFKGNLYSGGSYNQNTLPFVVDSCSFSINK